MTCPGQAQLAIANTAHAEALAIANTAHAEVANTAIANTAHAVEDGAAVEDDGKGKGRKGKGKDKGKGKQRHAPYFDYRHQHRVNVFTHPRGFMEKLAVVFCLV